MDHHESLSKTNLNPYNKKIGQGISLFTAVKNRKDALAESLKTWISNDQIDEIIIVDWSSDESLIPLVEKYQNGKIILAIVRNQPNWILSHAYNLGARLTSKLKILKMDADVKILPGFFEHHTLKPGMFFTGNWKNARDENEKHLHGISLMFRESFFLVNGYNEFVKSYGWDDIDLYHRLENQGLKRTDFKNDTLLHLPHDGRTSYQNHMSFINSINDTEKSLLNSLVNRFITSSYKQWTTKEKLMSFSIQHENNNVIYCTQDEEDCNIIPPEIMLQCESKAIIERFYELGTGFSNEFLNELTREELITLLNLYYAQHNSKEELNVFNLIKILSNKFNFSFENNRREANEYSEKALINEEIINSQTEIIRNKNHLIESLTFRLNKGQVLISNLRNQITSIHTSYSWKISHTLVSNFAGCKSFLNSLIKKRTSPRVSAKSPIVNPYPDNNAFDQPNNRNPPRKVNLGNQIGAYYGSHRSGWKYAFSALADLHNSNGILLDAFIERTFHWHPDGIHPHLEPWIGFIHVPPFVPNWLVSEVSNDSIFALEQWKESFKHCKGLYTLSQYHKRILQTKISIPINNLLHPTEEPQLKWEWKNFQRNNEKKIIQVGFWLRRLYSIHLLQADKYQKVFLRKEDANIDYLLEKERNNCEFRDQITVDVVNSVVNINFLSNHDYDILLGENIVFLDLYDASANNSIIECIVRNTPILVNPLEPVIEYLGPEYPFYFNDLAEATQKLQDMELIKKTHQYLLDHPLKNKLTAAYFKKSFITSSIYQNL